MADPTSVTPARADAVTLRGGDLPWRPVSPMLARVRLITLAIVLVPLLVASVAVGLLVTRWVLLGTLALLLLGAWVAWLIGRQVSAISWVELDEEIVIRKGRLFRSLVSVPYGRLQYVDVQAGPVDRIFGIARVQLHTAPASTDAMIPGLPPAEAARVRDRLAARGQARLAGL